MYCRKNCNKGTGEIPSISGAGRTIFFFGGGRAMRKNLFRASKFSTFNLRTNFSDTSLQIVRMKAIMARMPVILFIFKTFDKSVKGKEQFFASCAN